jgi:hypothetical protein
LLNTSSIHGGQRHNRQLPEESRAASGDIEAEEADLSRPGRKVASSFARKSYLSISASNRIQKPTKRTPCKRHVAFIAGSRRPSQLLRAEAQGESSRCGAVGAAATAARCFTPRQRACATPWGRPLGSMNRPRQKGDFAAPAVFRERERATGLFGATACCANEQQQTQKYCTIHPSTAVDAPDCPNVRRSA